MPISSLFRLCTSSVLQLPHHSPDLLGAVDSEIYSCLQWKSPNLEQLPLAAEQRFCVMYNEFLDDGLINVFELAYARGMLSPIKLIALHNNDLCLFLDSSATSSTLLRMQEWWKGFTELGLVGHFCLAFASEDEIYSGRSDCPLQACALTVMQSGRLGLQQYEFHDLEPFDPEQYSPDDMPAPFYPNDRW